MWVDIEMAGSLSVPQPGGGGSGQVRVPGQLCHSSMPLENTANFCLHKWDGFFRSGVPNSFTPMPGAGLWGFSQTGQTMSGEGSTVPFVHVTGFNLH